MNRPTVARLTSGQLSLHAPIYSPKGGENMATTKRNDQRSRQTRRRKEYEETPDWATAFQREDNEPPQPGFTGVGVLDAETLDAIKEAGGNFQLAIWTLDRNGEPLRNRDGTRRFRLHIEPPYEDPDAEDGDDDRSNQDNGRDDIPF